MSHLTSRPFVTAVALVLAAAVLAGCSGTANQHGIATPGPVGAVPSQLARPAPSPRTSTAAARTTEAPSALPATPIPATGSGAALLGSPVATTHNVPTRPTTQSRNLTPGTSARPATRATAAPVSVLERSVPVRLQVPAIGVDSSLMRLGLTSDGALQVPPGAFPAGWYTGSPSPGEIGPAVIVGHVDWGGRLGVFARLARLRRGDRATVVRADGSSATFEVNRVERFAKDAFPTQQVYGNIDHAGLRLITCGGTFDRSAHSYVDDVVVFADLVS